ncbi:unnamed protein product [Ranitomeya imitator]|uniref:S100/CaBP-9k-type calcium binding subdomain domain-containing protein n=1 Tax=Ranitomeya imitator TaxID=111125 RepID=A0ABN9LKX4_9NEOB|nr:unnamed protein product [Ranitomeya imitator]
MASSQTELERAIVTIVKCFFDHAGEEGKKETLSVNEFTKLTQMELPHLMKAPSPLLHAILGGNFLSKMSQNFPFSQDVSLEEKMKDLDINQDNELKFNEFWRLIGELSKQVKRDVKPKK